MNVSDLDLGFIKLFILLAITAFVSVIEYLMYRYLLPRFKRRQFMWRSTFLSALHPPLQIYIWLLAITFLASFLIAIFKFHTNFEHEIIIIRRALALLFFLWFVLRFLRDIETNLVNRAKAGVGHINDPTNINAFAQVIRIVLFGIILLMALQTAGVKMSAVLTFGGVIGAVFGFAAKDMLSNFFGGFIIYWDRPFSVGDAIRSPDRSIEGMVEQIGWRVTRISTLEKRPLYVPNGVLTSIALENIGRMSHRRLRVPLGVRYSDLKCIEELTQDIKNMLRKHPDIDQTQPISATLEELGSVSLNIIVYAFTKTIRWIDFQPIRQDVLLKLMSLLEKHGAELAFPTQTVQVPDGINLMQEAK